MKVLYLEHDPDREALKQAMEDAPAEVDGTIIFRDRETFLRDLDGKLRNERFDLVVTDAFFLPDGQDHDDTGQEGDYLLDEIVGKVREFEEFRTRIAALTRYGGKLLAEPMRTGLAKVDYLWNKIGITQAFIKWQVSRIREECERRFPAHLLVDRVIETCSGAEGSELPWHDNMNEMLKGYRTRHGEVNQISVVRGPLGAIAGCFDVQPEVLRLFDALARAESIHVAAKPAGWGHLRHVLNVFWFGYLVLNSGLFDMPSLWKTASRQTGVGRDRLRDEINFAWLLAALFHDIGLLGEKVQKLADDCNSLLSLCPAAGRRIEVSSKPVADASRIRELRGTLSAALGTDLAGWFERLWDEATQPLDHGVLSAITLIDALGNKSHLSGIVTSAAAAAAIHNLAKQDFQMPMVRVEEQPVAALLLLCDQIQAWERDTGYEEILGSFPLECAELTALELSREKRRMMCVINYYPFREILPQELKMEELFNKLQEKIRSGVKPILDRICTTGRRRPENTVKFSLDRRRELEHWELRGAD
jgi:hypothetical protein